MRSTRSSPSTSSDLPAATTTTTTLSPLTTTTTQQRPTSVVRSVNRSPGPTHTTSNDDMDLSDEADSPGRRVASQLSHLGTVTPPHAFVSVSRIEKTAPSSLSGINGISTRNKPRRRPQNRTETTSQSRASHEDDFEDELYDEDDDGMDTEDELEPTSSLQRSTRPSDPDSTGPISAQTELRGPRSPSTRAAMSPPHAAGSSSHAGKLRPYSLDDERLDHREQPFEVDESLYSRQLYVFGTLGQHRLQSSRVLVTGSLSGGLAAECCKNLCLAGVRMLHLQDDDPITVADFSGNFLLRGAKDLGRSRAEAMVAPLSELNSRVAVDVIKPGMENLSSYEVILVLNSTEDFMVNLSRRLQAVRDTLISENQQQQRPPPVLVCASTRGLAGFVFADFGIGWESLDRSGETPRSGLVLRVTPADPNTLPPHVPTSLLASTSETLRASPPPPPTMSSSFSGGFPSMPTTPPLYPVNPSLVGNSVVSDRLLVVFTDAPHGLDRGDVVRVLSGGTRTSRLCSVVARGRDSCSFYVAESDLVGPLRDRDAALAEFDFSSTASGYFEQVVVPFTCEPHAPFSTQVLAPKLVSDDSWDPNRPARLHAYWRGLWAFQSSAGGRLPEPGSRKDADAVVRLALDLAPPSTSSLSDSEKNELCVLATCAAGVLNPMAAFIGGVAAQEVLKACTGKFTPLTQWLHFAAPDALPKTYPFPGCTFPTLAELNMTKPLNSSDADETSWRFTGQAAVFGKEFQKVLAAKRVFVVGSGALGCETLKNLALMGVASSSSSQPGQSAQSALSLPLTTTTTTTKGMVHVTDPDSIETSNLNRQFLFREQHVGRNKAETAAGAVRLINPHLNVHAMRERVAPDTDMTFDDAFWDSIDIVVNALDNLPARFFVDSRCVYYGKPLLESGTLGTKANTLPVLPNLSESYGSDPVKDDAGGRGDVPACTLHAYPNLFEHLLAWARDAFFEREFVMDPSEALAFQEAKTIDAYRAELNRQPNSSLQRVCAARAVLCGVLPTDETEGLFPYSLDTSTLDASGCVRLARLRFEELFHNKIIQLLALHPTDKVGEDGKPFWSGKRRAPTPSKFDAKNPSHMLFVISAARLYARVHGLKEAEKLLTTSGGVAEDFVSRELAKMPPLPDFKPDADVAAKHFPPEGAAAAAKTPVEVSKTSAVVQDVKHAIDQEVARLEKWKATVGTGKGDTGKGERFIEPSRFDKDDDAHVDVIWAASCVRAGSYQIPMQERLEAKRVMGRIVPAIATTTAAATGLVALELYKLCNKEALDIERFRARNINLAVNEYTAFEPKPCSRRKTKFGEVDLWTVLTLRGDLTVRQVVDYFLSKFDFRVESLGTDGDVTLYNDVFADDTVLDEKVSTLYFRIVGKPPRLFIPLVVDGEFEEGDGGEGDEDETDVQEVVPPVCRLRWKEGGG